MYRFFHLIIICLIFQTTLQAQIPGFTQFNSNNGLPSNTVYDINQDENGFIWIATDYGLSRYDGLSFKNYTIADGLPDNEILQLFKDSKNRIWLIGFNGKMGYIQHQKIYNSENSDLLNDLIFENFISDIFEDSKNNIWFLQSLKTLKRLDINNQITSFNIKSLYQRNSSKQLQIVENINGEIRILKSISENENSNKIFSSSITNLNWTNLNLNLYDNSTILKLRNKKTEAFKNLDSVSMKISKEIFKNYAYKNSNNLLYRTTPFEDSFLITNLNKGALIINLKNKLKTKNILPLTQTTRAFVDFEKNIWIGSQSNGIYLFPNLNINGIQFEDKTQNNLFTVNEFQNKLVLGNGQSEIFILNKENLEIISSLKLNKNPKRIRQLKVHNNLLYILSDINIYTLNSKFDIENSISYNSDLKKIYLNNFKDIFISENYVYTANSNGIGKIDKTKNTSKKIWDKRSTAIYMDSIENLWIGTTSGLYKYNKKTAKKYNLGELFNSSIIYAIENSKKGLLIGSNSYGLGILKKGVFKIISTNNGLLSNYIKSIFVDKNNNIWLSTNFGLNCVELNSSNKIISIKSYTTSDGLYSNDVRASYVDENKVYVATSKGLNIIDLTNKLNPILPPTVHINSILINNKKIDIANNQQFSHRFNYFQFNFSGISFRSLGNITFKYRLKGLENDWITSKTNTVRFSSLRPNNYTFELKAISKNDLESDPVSFTFTINPPIYKTWWFRTLIILVLIALATYFINRRNSKIQQKRKTKEQISNLRYQALNAQMNPHFINNLLVNINSLVDKGEVKEVRESLNKFAELVNLILDATKSNLINLDEEIRMTKLYLELQKLRFNKNTTYIINTVQISSDLESIFVPPMILQPIIENCFKHGFKNGNKTNTISVDFKIENDEFLICEISDNGIGIQNIQGIPKSNNYGISFSNINERLRLINESKDEEKLIFISNLTDEFDNLVGLKVTLKIPLISF
ncbi:MAG: two-component regulator propeller domain-containing protein [Lutibacter sp.]|uniref:sensor histidine kinase n=1 Tax=Lutibacter sp. TaxID=1925666 RepID=UPI00385CBC93